MDNQRLLVWATFALMVWLTYEAWMTDYGPGPAAPATEDTPAETLQSPRPGGRAAARTG
ncbi:MAG: hypothetical protein U5K76_14350 [Woeseiaceae bacterium]|nr:hypothetical protein [Woeseiaceae bacterium]